MRKASVDRVFLTTVLILVLAGFGIYFSATLGLVARETVSVFSIVFNHIVLGMILGLCSLWYFSRFPYRNLRKYAFIIFIISFILTLLVFVPGLGLEYGGAKRWINLGFATFQPSEFLKLGYIIYLAAWLSSVRDKVKEWNYGFLPFFILSALVGVVLLLEPDTDSYALIFLAGAAMFLVAGARKRHLFALFGVGVVVLVGMAFLKPYIMQRFITFLDPSSDPRGAGYQIQQSLIAIGSGGATGRGFGQSVQKFNYLPEPIGDSIFAVAAEEFGFVGSVLLVLLYVAFALRGLRIAARAPDLFGGLIVLGIVILIVTQSFVNIAAMLGILPLSGLPLIFVSHGGTALFFALTEVGIVLNVSRSIKKINV